MLLVQEQSLRSKGLMTFHRTYIELGKSLCPCQVAKVYFKLCISQVGERQLIGDASQTFSEVGLHFCISMSTAVLTAGELSSMSLDTTPPP